MLRNVGVPYGSRTRVAAVKEKRPIVIQWNFAAWIALYRTLRTQENAYWTLSGLALYVVVDFLRLLLPWSLRSGGRHEALKNCRWRIVFNLLGITRSGLPLLRVDFL